VFSLLKNKDRTPDFLKNMKKISHRGHRGHRVFFPLCSLCSLWLKNAGEVKMKRFFLGLMLLCVISGTAFYPGCKKNDLNPDYSLQGIKWILESIQYSNQNIVPIERMFYVLFNEDLTFRMQVDCNNCNGTYALGANDSISFSRQMACTDAYCGDDSKDDEFHAALNTVSKYNVNGNRLRLYFNNEQSQLNFIAESSSL
jgi:heat shock protein HslJ